MLFKLLYIMMRLKHAMCWVHLQASINLAVYFEHLHQVYRNESVIPKMHFMVHFPEQMLRYGPLIHSWTMRHEAKLRVMKRAAKVSNF